MLRQHIRLMERRAQVSIDGGKNTPDVMPQARAADTLPGPQCHSRCQTCSRQMKAMQPDTPIRFASSIFAFDL